VQQSVGLGSMITQRCCVLWAETFEIARKAGRPRKYCPVCSPPGWQVVRVPGQSRLKLRRRPPSFQRPIKINKGVVVPMRDESA
jgi:hypothetical protein